jgi:hypothetical protein
VAPIRITAPVGCWWGRRKIHATPSEMTLSALHARIELSYKPMWWSLVEGETFNSSSYRVTVRELEAG